MSLSIWKPYLHMKYRITIPCRVFACPKADDQNNWCRISTKSITASISRVTETEAKQGHREWCGPSSTEQKIIHFLL